MIRLAAALAAALLPLIGGFAVAQEVKKQAGPPPVLVVTAAVEKGAVQPEVSLVGTVRPRAESVVAAEGEGLVLRVGARRGQTVVEGDMLAVLRDADLEERLEAANSEVRLARAEREKAGADLARAEDLVAKQVAPAEQLDSAHRDVQVWEQRVAKARSEVRLLEARIGRQTVRAPLGGVVVEEFAEVGEWVEKGGAVVRLVDIASVRVRMPVPERYVVQIREGAEVPVRFDALPGREFRGPVMAIIPLGDPQARTFPVEVAVRNPGGDIRPGMTARATFHVGRSQAETLVPKDALVPKGPRTLIYMVVDGKAVEVPVQVVGYRGAKAAVRGDLPPGAPVIVRGNERVRPGQAVATAR